MTPLEPPESSRPIPIAGARTMASPMFAPADVSRAELRRGRKQSRRIEQQARLALLEHRREQIRAERDERRTAAYLPAAGEGGPDALRATRRLRTQPHRATSDVLGAAYPFLAEAGLGTEGLFIGQDAWSGSSFCYDPWVLYRDGCADEPQLPARRRRRQGQVDPRQGARHSVDRVRAQGLRAG